ncbi:hypothetical protein AVEN_57448-1 [Araneus ventricosus]|uniref:Uncharacterized protein n=1 Tax=Araneus ventricosus TaxID=182803 RepID=A0A4Y2CWZ5_ARAVE|nr:hypothetical protein AVEN_57448-1 [Araneus ventricosus]
MFHVVGVSCSKPPVKTYSSRVSKYAEYASELKFEPDMTFPFTLNKVPKFETLNEISIKVFGYEETLEMRSAQCKKDQRRNHKTVGSWELGGGIKASVVQTDDGGTFINIRLFTPHNRTTF